MKELSIIVPVYNGEGYIEKCLESILEQNLPNDQYEIIVIDDGSTDLSSEIADKYQKKYSHVRVIHKRNEGLPQARKTGVLNAEGKYIAFVDVDDWIEKDMYSVLLQAIKKYDVDMVCCNYAMEYEDKRKEQIISDSSKLLFFDSYEGMKRMHERKNIYQFAWNKLYKKELFKNITFPTANIIGEDYTITVQLIQNCNRIMQIPNVYYHYLQRNGSMCKNGYTDNHYLAYKNYENIYSFLVKKYPKLKKIITNYHLQEYLVLCIPMCRNDKYNYELLKDTQKKFRNNFWGYFFTSNDGLKFKSAALLMLINPSILMNVYKRTFNRR